MTISSRQHGLRIGLDLGGSKIEGILMNSGAAELARYRVASPRDDYPATIEALVGLTAKLIQGVSGAKVGIAVPGSISKAIARDAEDAQHKHGATKCNRESTAARSFK